MMTCNYKQLEGNILIPMIYTDEYKLLLSQSSRVLQFNNPETLFDTYDREFHIIASTRPG